MEVVITYIKGYPSKTKLTYRHEDVVQRIVSEWSNNTKPTTRQRQHQNQNRK